MIKTNFFHWADGKTVSSYVWTNENDIKWFVINIEEAKGIYPKLYTLQAVKQLTKDRFKGAPW